MPLSRQFANGIDFTSNAIDVLRASTADVALNRGGDSLEIIGGDGLDVLRHDWLPFLRRGWRQDSPRWPR